MNKADKQQQFMKACLNHVVFDGWSPATFQRAITDLNITKGEAKRLFPGEIADVLEHFMQSLDVAMVQALKTRNLETMKLGEQVEEAITARLHAALPHREGVRRAVAWYALPFHAHLGIKRLYNTTDAIWRAIGHHPTDFSYYTKRFSLGAIYSTTLMFWLNDHSDDLSETRAFLKRRLSDLFTFHKLKQKLKAGAYP